MRISRSSSASWASTACCLLLMTGVASSGFAAQDSQVLHGADWVSAPSPPTVLTVDMQNLPVRADWKPGDPIREIPRRFTGDPNAPVPVARNATTNNDPLAGIQRAYVPRGSNGFGTPLVNLDVLANPSISPNDPTGDIGPTHFVASVNSASGAQFAVYNKETGATIVTPTLMQGLGSGGACASGLGDPIVLFDELANRWMLTEFTDGANVLCVYLSNGPDISGVVNWTRYAFTIPTFPDYPKYGIWPDAYYVGANENNAVYAMDRQKMLAGQAATLQRFLIPELAGFGFQMIQPADLAGSEAPPLGSPGIFMRHRDDEAHNPGSNNPASDFLEMFEFRVNWVTPASSSITGPISFPMAEFSSDLNGLSAFQAFPQPNGTRLDPLRETVMHRLTYRNMGTHELLVGNLVTDLFLGAGSTYPNDTGAIRWFEMRRLLGPPDRLFANGFENAARGAEEAWALYQQGTFAPADGTPAEQADRWMAASSVDESGNIALAYNVVRQSPAISAGVRYTGRLASDPLGLMTAGDNLIVAGSGSITGIRWGDYNDMGIDPVDGCTFWFIGNYVNGSARANRAASFKFDECGGPSFSLSSPAPTAAVCANSASPTNATPITLNASANNGFVGAVSLTYPSPFATGINGTLTPPTIATLPGSSVAQLTATNAATPGTSTITARGTSGAIIRNLQLALTVATATPALPTLLAPANNATGVSATPTFSWSAVAQAASYQVQAATTADFASPLFTQSVVGTSLVAPLALPTNQQIFWRVRATNVCGGTDSLVFSYNGPTFNMATTTPSVAVCANQVTASDAPPISIDLTAVNGFVGTVAMSYPNPFATGLSGTLTPPNPSVPGSSIAQLSASNLASPGAASVLVRGTAGLTTRELTLTLNVSTLTPAAPALTAPADVAINVPVVPTFSWAAVAQASSYVVEASLSNTFASLLFTQTVTGTSLVSPVALPPNTQIFWRVRAVNACGTGVDSVVFSFTTANVQEFCRNGLNLAIPDNNLTGVSDNLVIAGTAGNVGDLDVRVELTHTFIGDLRVRLARSTPAATVNLVTNPTNNPTGTCTGNDMAATFDDETNPARPAQSACNGAATPTYAGSITPQQVLTAFDGQSANATWTLTIIDSANIDTGTLTRWCVILN